MSNPDLPENSASKKISSYDFEKLLQYSGPNQRRDHLLPSDISIFDYVNSDKNENNLIKLLSSQSIAFHIERPQRSWSQLELGLTVSVPYESLAVAMSLLDAATEFGALEKVKGF